MTPDAPSTYLEYCASKTLDPGKSSSLEAYLAEIHDEDWNAEFKAAVNDIDHGLREAVAALANHDGGEIFLGVKDETRALDGTRLRKVNLPGKLRQAGRMEDGFILDLSPLARRSTEVAHAEPDKRILVIEVDVAPLPALVVEDDGSLAWYVRNGKSNRKLEPLEWVRRTRDRVRGRLLLELYREFKGKVESIPRVLNFLRLDPDLFRLPRYEQARSDGSIYASLDQADRNFLVTNEISAQTGSGAPGILERFMREGKRVVDYSEREIAETGRLSEARTGNEVRVLAMNMLQYDVASFRSYLLERGVLQAPG